MLVRRDPQASLAIAFEDVLDDGARLRQPDVVVIDHRRCASRMKGLVRSWRQRGYGIALIAPELVFKAKLLAEPDDAIRLANAEVVNISMGVPRGSAADAHPTPPETQTIGGASKRPMNA